MLSTVLRGDLVAITATPTFSSYNFYVNSVLKNSGASGIFTTTELNDGDTVSVIASANNCSFTCAPLIMHETVINASFTSLDTVVVGDTVHFSNTTTGAVEWLWDFGDTTTSSEQQPTHVYSVSGPYTVTLVASVGSCSDTAIKTIIVNAAGDVANEVRMDEEFTVTAFPNPGNGTVTVEGKFPHAEKIILRVVDNKGGLVAAENIGRTNYFLRTLDLHRFAKGTYYIEAEVGGRTQVRKILLQ